MPSRLRIPGATTGVSDNWNAHRARGSLGGTDFVDGRGTVMHAMAEGTVVAVDNSPDGSGGRMITIRHNEDGHFTEELHATLITIARGTPVSWGDDVGISGGSGYGDDYYYGAHIHAHAITPSGIRYSVEPYIDWSRPTGTPSIPIVETKEEDEEMTDIIYYADSAQGAASAPLKSEKAGTYKGKGVQPESMWYQECVGAPLFPLSNNAAYTSIAGGIEYGAFMSQKDAVQAKRFGTSAAAIAALIEARGITDKPSGNFAGTIDVGDVAIDNRDVVKGLAEVVAAIVKVGTPAEQAKAFFDEQARRVAS